KNIISERSSDRVIKSIVFCSGKIYYDLQNHLNKNAPNSSTKLVRIEQLYPFPAEEIQELLKEYHLVQKVFFAQEEPQNQGIWGWIAPRLQKLCPIAVTVEYIGRPESAAPATGWAQRHKEELANLLSDFEKKIR
ncbi:MAG: 2-oxoglutarate dehydrogenase subunit E1, partial [Gammaproteobacteria bacterium]|nr:2-oxoglutarate dehydrogenase subunit E1 [Gammaproteobacteria bacterium]